MELDDFKQTGYSNSEKLNPEDIVNKCNTVTERLREVLTKQGKIKKTFIVFLLILSVVYINIMSHSEERTGLTLIAAGFISGAIYLFFRYKPLPDSLYLLPPKEFIELAYHRLHYFTKIDWLILIPILTVLGIGGGIHLIYRLSRYTEKIWVLILIWVIFYICLCIFGFFAGKKNWQKEFGNLLEEVQKIKESLSAGDH